MANPEHLKILLSGVRQWNVWRSLNPEIIPDLSDVNLRNANLSNLNISWTDLNTTYLNRVGLCNPNPLSANLSGVNLRNAILCEALLFGVRFSGGTLVDANFKGAQLDGAQFDEANLAWANLRGTNLGGSNFSRAKLFGADLSVTNLNDVNLCGSDLREANLSRANVHLSNFDGAQFCHTRLVEIDLSEVNGLDSVKHSGPSPISIETLYRSHGKIPDVFLRGCGVPELFIQYVAAIVSKPIEYYSCFISYNHTDKAFARRLHDALQGQGIRCWRDEKQLLPGDHIHTEIDTGIRLWDKVLLCCSESSMKSWWVDKEISKALQKEERLWKERGKQVLVIIPLNLDGFILDLQWQDWKKQHLTDRLAADFKGWETDSAIFEIQLQSVIKALRADGGARQKPLQSLL